MIAPVLELRGVSKRFGGIRALERVSLSVEDGSTVAIIGPNGAGKSTLFALISGELQPSDGAILLAGRDLRRLAPERRARLGLGRTFQSARLFAGLTVRENVELALVRRGWREDEVREALAEVRLLERLERRAGCWSSRWCSRNGRGCCCWTSRRRAWAQTSAPRSWG
jgi:branched-chain amino acid transport system ATP-binding protein